MIILTFTPGLDSFLSNWVLTKQGIDFKRVYFDLNGIYNNVESNFLIEHYDSNSLDIQHDLSIRNFEDVKTAHVPNRNLLLATLAQSIYNADEIYINGVKDDRTEDQGQCFYDETSSILSRCSGKKVIVKSALIEKEKTLWCKDFVEENPDKSLDLLFKTYSCFQPNVNGYPKSTELYEKVGTRFVRKYSDILLRDCRNCPACYRRLAALTSVNIYVPFNDIDMANSYINRIDPKIHPHRYITAMQYATFLNQINKND